MSTLGQTALTLADWAKRLDPQGKIDKVVEILSVTNEILEDMLWLPTNSATGHRTTIRSGLPTVTWRLLNYGVQPSKSRTVQVTDTVGMLEAYAKIDVDLAELNGNTSDFRLSEDKPFIEAMNQELASVLFYGNTATNAEKFMGFAPRYNSLSAANADNIIDAGGTGSTNLSIWLVVWGDNTCHGLFPNGSKAGLTTEDLGKQLAYDDQTPPGQFMAYQTKYQWKPGLTLRDWRYVVRVCNIDRSALTKNAASGADIIDLMTQALELVKDLNAGKAAFYVNRSCRSYLRRQITNKVASGTLSMESVAGKRVVMFGEVPVRRCDALLNTEARVT